MTTKLRENFFVLLTSNLCTIILVILLQMVFADTRSEIHSLQKMNVSFVFSDILYYIVCAMAVCAVFVVLKAISKSNVVINNNISPTQSTIVSTGDKVDELREQHRQKEENICAARYNLVKDYTYFVMSPYLQDDALEVLCQDIRLFDIPDSIVSPIVTDGRLTTLDLRHYAWNVGERLGWSGQKRATFVKLVFPKEMKEMEIETIRRNLRMKAKCIIDIDIPESGCYNFHVSK